MGTAAIQIAGAIGARVAVTCSAGKVAACLALGADVALERSPHDWLADAGAAVPGGFDVVLDVIGGDESARNLEAVAQQGRILQVGLMGSGAVSINAGMLLAKRATWIGTTLRMRPLEQKAALAQRFATEVLPLFDSGRLRPVVDRVLPFADIAEGHRILESNVTIGKVVLEAVEPPATARAAMASPPGPSGQGSAVHVAGALTGVEAGLERGHRGEGLGRAAEGVEDRLVVHHRLGDAQQVVALGEHPLHAGDGGGGRGRPCARPTPAPRRAPARPARPG